MPVISQDVTPDDFNDSERRRTLPSKLVEISNAIGPECALKLAAAKGGTRLEIPAHLDKATVLLKLIGPAATAKMCAIFGGERMDIPTAYMRPSAKALIAKYPEISTRDLAVRVGCSRRYVEMVRQEIRDVE